MLVFIFDIFHLWFIDNTGDVFSASKPRKTPTCEPYIYNMADQWEFMNRDKVQSITVTQKELRNSFWDHMSQISFGLYHIHLHSFALKKIQRWKVSVLTADVQNKIVGSLAFQLIEKQSMHEMLEKRQKERKKMHTRAFIRTRTVL